MQAVVIGNFDGVHLGHRRLFELAREGLAAEGASGTKSVGPGDSGSSRRCLAESTREARGARDTPEQAALDREAPSPRGRVVAITFEPLPAAVLAPSRAPRRLTDSVTRTRLLHATCGVDEVRELIPTVAFLGRSPEEFLDELRRETPFTLIVEGPDFRFGKNRSGSVETLAELGRSRGFRTVVAPPVRVALADGRQVEARSSAVREALIEGRVADAAAILGRAYEVSGTTERGDQRGRTIGWPTANLAVAEQLLPADGVYAGSATLPDGRTALAAISIGTKPTFGESPRTCEATLLQPDGTPLGLPLDWYGWSLSLHFTRRLRGMEKFDSLDALLAEMERDRKRVLG